MVRLISNRRLAASPATSTPQILVVMTGGDTQLDAIDLGKKTYRIIFREEDYELIVAVVDKKECETGVDAAAYVVIPIDRRGERLL